MSVLAELSSPATQAVLADALGRWVPQQRWFGGKARRVEGVAIADTAHLPDDDAAALLVLADVSYADGGSERYQVPLAVGEQRPDPHTVVTQLGHLVVVDATTVPAACRLLGRLSVSADLRTRAGAHLSAAPTTDVAPELREPRRMGVEQSNTSIVFDERHILKVFRRLEHGVNPDVEITAALTRASFRHTPAQRGALLLSAGSQHTALTILTDFVPGAREGWALATSEVAHLQDGGERALLAATGDLGAAVGALHVALHEAFPTRPGTAADTTGWAAAMRAQAGAVLATARERAAESCAPVLARSQAITARLDAIAAVQAPGPLGRTHGDLHLGQALLTPDGTWQILDFEGEPARSLAQRQAPASPLRDVAGMLRSFDYAAAALDPARPPEAAQHWRNDARARFLAGYQAAADRVLPHDEDTLAALLVAFELDKAVYELGYELANRPAWVPIPTGGILRLLEGDGSVGTG